LNQRSLKLTLVLGLLTTAGCTINAPQLASVKRLIPTFGQSSQESLAPFAWSFSMAGTQYRVYAQKVQGRRVIFMNDYGMEVVWDGDSFIIIQGIPGGFGLYRSGRELNALGQEERWYAMASSLVHRARCTPPRLWRLSDDRYGWRQRCVGTVDGVTASSDHVVEFDSQGRIREIEASVFPGGPRFALKKIDR
jgi:hypothetical protein